MTFFSYQGITDLDPSVDYDVSLQGQYHDTDKSCVELVVEEFDLSVSEYGWINGTVKLKNPSQEPTFPSISFLAFNDDDVPFWGFHKELSLIQPNSSEIFTFTYNHKPPFDNLTDVEKYAYYAFGE